MNLDSVPESITTDYLKGLDYNKLGLVDSEGNKSLKDPESSDVEDDLSFEDMLQDEEDELADLKGKPLSNQFNKPTSTSIVHRNKTGDFDSVKVYYDQVEQFTVP